MSLFELIFLERGRQYTRCGLKRSHAGMIERKKNNQIAMILLRIWMGEVKKYPQFADKQ